MVLASVSPLEAQEDLLEPKFQVLAILVVTLGLFISEVISVDLIAILVLLALTLLNILPIDEALKGFGHPAVIGVGALFVVSEGLLRTGALGFVANRIEKWSRGKPLILMSLMLSIVLVSSAFLNNTPVVAMFIPVAMGLSFKMGMNPSKILLPLSYAAILGGTCTLIGTSTNILVSSIVEQNGGEALGMFEFTRLGWILASVGFIYLLTIGKHLIPERQTITSLTSMSGDPRHHEYVTELEIREGGGLIGKKFTDSVLYHAKGVQILQVIRGEEIIWPPLDRLILERGDALVISGSIESLMEIQEKSGLATLDEIVSESAGKPTDRETELAEVLVLPNSHYIGMDLASVELRRRFGLNVLAIQRHGMHLRRKISEHPLRVGDLLLVQGTNDGLERIRAEEGLLLMAGVNDVVVRKSKAPLALFILAGVIVMLATRPFPMATVALIGAAGMVLSGCLPAGKVYDAIHWRVLVLIAGMLALGAGMQTTGAAQWVADGIQSFGSALGPRGLVVAILILSSLLTEAISNTAVAAVMIPVALSMAAKLGVDATPFVMAVAYGASCSFLTPIGYQTNTLVYGAGGYRFGDFARLGIPLVILVWSVGGWLIPVFWPL